MESNTQPIERLDHSSPRVLDLHSMFYTIQGEGPFAGRPAVFIRLAGCNLQCPGCDTEYTTGRQTIDTELIAIRAAHLADAPLVVITGGEPFRQDISQLVTLLHGRGCTVQIETNGVIGLPAGSCSIWDYPDVHIVVSPKVGKVHPSIADRASAYKYVLSAWDTDPTDGLPIRALFNNLPSTQVRVARPPEGFPTSQIYVNPMDEQNPELNQQNLAAVAKSCLTHGYTAGVQMHKYMNLE